MTDLSGVHFETAWENRKEILYGATPAYMISIEDLIRLKKKAARDQDLIDLKKIFKYTGKK